RNSFFDARVDFRNGHALGIHGLRVLINLSHEVRDRLNAEIDPSNKARIVKVAKLDISSGVQASSLFERRDGVFVKACPAFLPTFEMGHPVGDVNVNPVNPGSRNLAHALHVSLTPLGGIRADPNVFVAGGNPKGRTAAEDRWLAGALPLNPVGMIFEEGMLPLIGARRDAFEAGNVDESIITCRMGLLGDGFDRSKLFSRIEKTFVAPRNVIIRLDSEDMRIAGVFDDGIDAVQAQTVSADPHKMRPM